jgi:hypothetical protein
MSARNQCAVKNLHRSPTEPSGRQILQPGVVSTGLRRIAQTNRDPSFQGSAANAASIGMDCGAVNAVW